MDMKKQVIQPVSTCSKEPRQVRKTLEHRQTQRSFHSASSKRKQQSLSSSWSTIYTSPE